MISAYIFSISNLLMNVYTNRQKTPFTLSYCSLSCGGEFAVIHVPVLDVYIILFSNTKYFSTIDCINPYIIGTLVGKCQCCQYRDCQVHLLPATFSTYFRRSNHVAYSFKLLIACHLVINCVSFIE